MSFKNKSFNGNSAIRKPGCDIEYTEDMIRSIVKIKKDPLEFFRHLKIITLDNGVTDFNPYEYQVRLIKNIHTNRFTVALMPRQSGKSQVLAAYALFYALTNRHKRVAVLANKMATAREVFGRIQDLYEMLPEWLQIGVVEWNKTSFKLENGSSVFCAPTTLSSIRGKTINLLILDEFAFVRHAEEFFTSSYPVISSGSETKIVIISTPNGRNLFKQIYEGAVNKTNKFTPFMARWDEHPARRDKFKEETIANIGQEAWDQEYSLNFIGSGGTLISGQTLEVLGWSKPIAIDNQFTRIYKKPEADHMYIVAADVAEGVGLDSSTAIVIDLTRFLSNRLIEVVAVYENNRIPPEEFASVLASIGNRYNEAFIVNENNSIGRSVGIDLLNTEEYENTIRSKSDKGAFKLFGKGSIPGIRTSSTIKRLGCSALKRFIERDILVVNDKNIIDQLNVFSKSDDGKYAAQPGYHDDLITPLWLTCFLLVNAQFNSVLAEYLDYDDLTLSEPESIEDSDDADDD